MAQTVLITGGSRGIGAACVRTFAENGWNTAFTYSKSRERRTDWQTKRARWRSVPTSRIPRPWNSRSRKGRRDSVPSMPCLQCRHRRTEAVPEYHRRGLDAYAGCQSYGYGAHDSCRAA
ncbi:MAG: SDR family NAD(P)-dependent oxidoreductase [Butyricicoccus sp.]